MIFVSITSILASLFHVFCTLVNLPYNWFLDSFPEQCGQNIFHMLADENVSTRSGIWADLRLAKKHLLGTTTTTRTQVHETRLVLNCKLQKTLLLFCHPGFAGATHIFFRSTRHVWLLLNCNTTLYLCVLYLYLCICGFS